MSSPATTPAGLADLPRAIQERDAAAQAALYADDAVLTTIDAEHGPSNPLVAARPRPRSPSRSPRSARAT